MKENRINRLASVMVDHGVDNAMLAKAIKTTRETISKYRQNKMQPSLKKLLLIAEFFRISPGELLVTPQWPAGPSPADIAIAAKEKAKAAAKKKSSKKR